MAAAAVASDDDYKVLADGLKDRGNDAMNNNDIEGAIELYTQVCLSKAFIIMCYNSAILFYLILLYLILSCDFSFPFQAIDIDPDNHIYYSNRSAAYMKMNYISKALWDAEKCVSLSPQWAKGYNRLGVAQQALGRFDAAVSTFKRGNR